MPFVYTFQCLIGKVFRAHMTVGYAHIVIIIYLIVILLMVIQFKKYVHPPHIAIDML